MLLELKCWAGLSGQPVSQILDSEKKAYFFPTHVRHLSSMLSGPTGLVDTFSGCIWPWQEPCHAGWSNFAISFLTVVRAATRRAGCKKGAPGNSAKSQIFMFFGSNSHLL